MITFFAALALLILGYFTCGKLAERIFNPARPPAPAVGMADGGDYAEGK